MATRKILIKGYNHAVNSAATVTFDGVEVFSGALTANVLEESLVTADDTTVPVKVFEFEYNNADDTTETQHALNIQVTAGQIRVGNLWIEATRDQAVVESYDVGNKNRIPSDFLVDGIYYWPIGDKGTVYSRGSDQPERINILINDAEPVSTGYDGNHSGHSFVLSAGDTFSCTARVPHRLLAD